MGFISVNGKLRSRVIGIGCRVDTRCIVVFPSRIKYIQDVLQPPLALFERCSRELFLIDGGEILSEDSLNVPLS